MQTSTLILRPFVPLAVGTDREKELGEKDSCAKIIYGGVTIELSPEVIRHLQFGVTLAMKELGDLSENELRILSFGLEEMRLEMIMNQERAEKCLPEVWFRDNPQKCSLRHPWCPICLDGLSDFDKNHFEWDETKKDHTNTVWKTKW